MIRISEKDLLFIIVNLIGFMAWASYLCLDFIAMIAQVMAAADPQYANIEVGFALVRATGYTCMVSLGLTVLGCDLWWAYRMWKRWCKSYWRENL
jgi:hypothetical protein